MKTDDRVSVDELFALLSESRQRLVLQYFKQHANPIDLDALAARVARWEENNGEQPSSEAVADVRSALHQTHLPLLVALELADYDRAQQTVTYDSAAITAIIHTVRDVLSFLWDADERPAEDEPPGI